MEKNVEVSLLLDFYGDFLTQRQRDALMAHCDEDLSLAEIAEQYGISRQGVRDALVRGTAALQQMEQKLGLARKFRNTMDNLDALETLCKNDDEAMRLISAIRSIWEE